MFATLFNKCGTHDDSAIRDRVEFLSSLSEYQHLLSIYRPYFQLWNAVNPLWSLVCAWSLHVLSFFKRKQTNLGFGVNRCVGAIPDDQVKICHWHMWQLKRLNRFIRAYFQRYEHLQLLLSSVLGAELDRAQHGTTLNKCRVLWTVWKRIICEAKVTAVRFSAVFTGDKHLERECEHLQTPGYNVNIVPYRLINDPYPDTGSELQPQMNYEWVTP